MNITEIWLIICVVAIIIYNVWLLRILSEEHATLMSILNHNLTKIFQKLK